MALDFSTSQLWTLGDDAKMFTKFWWKIISSHKNAIGKLLSKYEESKIKAFLDLKILKTFLALPPFLEGCWRIWSTKSKFIEKERDGVTDTVDWLTNNITTSPNVFLWLYRLEAKNYIYPILLKLWL